MENTQTKTLYDISWKVSEEEYRNDPALSYSTLARFNREGFNNLDTLFEKVESPSLRFGSAVDAIITGGIEEFDKQFMVADFPAITDSVLKVVKEAFTRGSEQYSSLSEFPDSALISITEDLKYQLNWKPETRAKVIREQGSEYYSLMYIAGDRVIISTEEKEQIDNTVEALRTSEATKIYFQQDNPFDNIKREYQLKFKANLRENIEYRCMADLLVINYDNKTVYPIDLKTSSHTEWDFYKSFVDWSYQIQARLYWKIIRANMDEDDFFKDFKLDNYRFIVVNKKTLTPLVWEFKETQVDGPLYHGKNNQIEFKDPQDLGILLNSYLSTRPKVPYGINYNEDNDLVTWLNTI